MSTNFNETNCGEIHKGMKEMLQTLKHASKPLKQNVPFRAIKNGRLKNEPYRSQSKPCRSKNEECRAKKKIIYARSAPKRPKKHTVSCHKLVTSMYGLLTNVV